MGDVFVNVLLGVLFAIRSFGSVPTLAAALVRNPAVSRPDFFNAANWVFCLPLRAAVPNPVAGFTVDYTGHGLSA
jgi:hypothetical protein